MKNEVVDLGGVLGCERGDDVVEFSPLVSDSSSGELGLDLREPDLWVGGPKGRKFDVHCCYVGSYQCCHCVLLCRHSLASGSPM